MKTLLSTEHNAEWIQTKNRVEFYRDIQIPPRDLITSVHILAFRDDQILFTKHPERGWDIPGGHVEKDETPEAALKREVYEETCVKLVNLQVFGYIKVTLLEKNLGTSNLPFPESYILLYVGHIDSLDPFVSKHETRDRQLFTPAEAEELSWVRRHRIIYDAAFEEIMKVRNK